MLSAHARAWGIAESGSKHSFPKSAVNGGFVEQKKAKILAKNDPLSHTIQHREICCNRLILNMVGARERF
jgi:hypothetical protein